jgi:hypothetical protein
MSEPDFDFGLGNGRYLKGRGWRGIMALALVLAAVVAISPIVTPALSGLLHLISASKNP